LAKVLVVDDAEFVRVRTGSFLSQKGYEIVEAADGAQAVEKYQAEQPDVVLMDITMPVMDGISAVRAIRELDPQARIIMCSAVGQKSMVIESLKAGAKDFVLKPFQPEKLLQTLEKHLGE